MPKSFIFKGKEQDLTLKTFGQLLKNKHFPDSEAGGYKYFDTDIEKQIGDKPLDKAQWVLMTKEVLRGERDQSYRKQQTLVSDLSENSGVSCEMPKILKATVCIYAEYLNTGSPLYSDNRNTYIGCQEKLDAENDYQVIVGGFTLSGLSVKHYRISTVYDNICVAALRKF
jgi:hypothetical protein